VSSSRIIDYFNSHFGVKASGTQRWAGVAWNYCRFDQADKQSVESLVQGLIRQLCDATYRDEPRDIGWLLKLLQKLRNTNSTSELNLCFPFLSDFAKSRAQDNRKTTIIIDALDEFPKEDSQNATRDYLIEQLLKLPVRVLITSRDIPDIKGKFLDASQIIIHPRAQDIQDYVHWRIYDEKKGHREFRKLLKDNRDEKVEGKIVETLTRKYSEV
jgi:hypothetical protein